MLENPKVNDWKNTLGRVVIFCVCCAIILAGASRLTQGLPIRWSQHLLAFVATVFTFCVTVLFLRRERLTLKNVGIKPGNRSIRRLFTGFLIGLILAFLQPMLVLLSGHIKLLFFPGITFSLVISNLLLYTLIACREELAFRGYPLRSLTYAIGAWKAQLIIAIIFSLEHIVGGTSWVHAFSGAGVGAILFGIAALKTKGLALPVGLHAAWNFGQWCMGFKSEPGIWQAAIEKGYENQIEQVGSVCYLVVMVLAIAAFYYYPNKPTNAAGNHIKPAENITGSN